MVPAGGHVDRRQGTGASCDGLGGPALHASAHYGASCDGLGGPALHASAHYIASPTFPFKPSHSQVPSNKVASVTSPIVHVAVHGGGLGSVVATGHECELGSTFTTKPVVGNGASPCFDQSVDCVVEQVSRDELT